LKAFEKANWSVKPRRAAISLIERSLNRSSLTASRITLSIISCFVERPVSRVRRRDRVPVVVPSSAA